MVTFDFTSASTGQLGGLGKKLKELRKAAWEAHEEQEKDPCVTKILNFLSESNVAIPSSRRKLTIKFMLEQL